MGDAADMVLEGLLCEGCGDLFDDLCEPGYPRKCELCERRTRSAKSKDGRDAKNEKKT